MLADTHGLVRTSWNGSAARRAPKCLEDEWECNQKIPLLGSSPSWATDNFLGPGPSHAVQMSVPICASFLDHFQLCGQPALSLWGLQPWCFLSRFWFHFHHVDSLGMLKICKQSTFFGIFFYYFYSDVFSNHSHTIDVQCLFPTEGPDGREFLLAWAVLTQPIAVHVYSHFVQGIFKFLTQLLL